MKVITINLDGRPIKIAADALAVQIERLSRLIEDSPADHPARLFDLPIGDLWEALTQTGMLAVVDDGDFLKIIPHPALVNFAGLIDAICEALEARTELNVARDKGLAERS